MKREPRFDIFSGSFKKRDLMWIEAVLGLSKARARMEELAAEAPGEYFVFSMRSRAILAKIDTTEKLVRATSPKDAQGAA